MPLVFRLLVHAHVASAVRGLFKVESPCYLCQQQKIAALPSKTVHEPAPARKTSIDSLGSFGVNIHFTDALPNELAMLSRAFSAVRTDFHWRTIETVKGVYNFSAFDTLLASLEEHAVRPYFILDYGNELYDGGLSPSTPAGIEAFKSFVTAALNHFGGRRIIWELWNEPNGNFWKPTPNATQYGTLADAVCSIPMLKSEILIGPALAGISGEHLDSGGWFDTLLKQSNALTCFDAISVHPYRTGGPESVLDDYRRLRSLMATHRQPGAALPSIVSGEWGYSTCTEPCDQPGPEVPEDVQAKYLPRQFMMNMMAGVNLSIWYDWRDGGEATLLLVVPLHHFLSYPCTH
jgi:hypothetical protein